MEVGGGMKVTWEDGRRKVGGRVGLYLVVGGWDVPRLDRAIIK